MPKTFRVACRNELSEFIPKPSDLEDGDGLKETHYCMDGAKLRVPHAREDAFLQLYAAHIANGGLAYVIAKKTSPVFRLFFDFDLHLLELPHDGWYEEIVRTLLDVVDEVYEGADAMHAIVCTTDHKQDEKKGVACTKVGVHVHLPELHTTREDALFVRTALVQKLCNRFGERPSRDGPTTWDEDVDERVLSLSTGLRLNYSRKLVPCPACTRRQCAQAAGISRQDIKDTCERCLGSLVRGKIDEGRAYVARFRVERGGQSRCLADEPMISVLRECNIRSTLLEPSHRRRETPPCWLEMPAFARGVKRTRRVMGTITEGHDAAEAGLHDRLSAGAEVEAQVARWIQKQAAAGRAPKEYRRVDVSAAFLFAKQQGGARTVLYARMNSQFCANIGRAHTSNTVYLELDRRNKVACFKCYCRCKTQEGRVTRAPSGRVLMCSEYRSVPMPAAELCDVVRAAMPYAAP